MLSRCREKVFNPFAKAQPNATDSTFRSAIFPHFHPICVRRRFGAILRQRSCGSDAIFAPLHYERGYAYPLLVWLHGQGGNERQLQRIMPFVSMRNYVAVALRGNRLPEPSDTEAYGWLQTEEHIQQAQQGVFDSLELASRRFNVCTQRIFPAVAMKAARWPCESP